MRATVIAALGEMRKGILSNWTYRMDFISSFATLRFVFVAVSFLMGDGKIEPQETASMPLGYVSWAYAFWAIINMSANLTSEITTGTVEQLAMSPAPTSLLLLSRALVSLLWTTCQMGLLVAVAVWLLGASLPLRWEGLVVLALTVIGILGFGFMLAGGTLVFKRFDALANLVQNALLFLNGTLLPVQAMPGWLASAARLLPSTQGIVVLRQVVLGGQSLAAVWHEGSLVWLAVHSAAYLAVGWLVFGYCERVAKGQGTLGQY